MNVSGSKRAVGFLAGVPMCDGILCRVADIEIFFAEEM
jgi:hypothetical protein